MFFCHVFGRAMIAGVVLSTAACSQTPICAEQQDPQGILLAEYMLGLSPLFTPHPRGYVADPAEELVRTAMAATGLLCGQPVCATSVADARARFAEAIGDHNPADPILWVSYLGITPGDALASQPAANAAWNAAGGPCYDGYQSTSAAADAGAAGVCANLEEPCLDAFEENRLPSQICCGSYVCNADTVTGVGGTCCVQTGDICQYDEECCPYNGDHLGETCQPLQGSGPNVCCLAPAATCDPGESYCCTGDCIPDDTSAAGYICDPAGNNREPPH